MASYQFGYDLDIRPQVLVYRKDLQDTDVPKDHVYWIDQLSIYQGGWYKAQHHAYDE